MSPFLLRSPNIPQYSFLHYLSPPSTHSFSTTSGLSISTLLINVPHKCNRVYVKISFYCSGVPGLSAYIGLTEVAKAKPGETLGTVRAGPDTCKVLSPIQK
jgi:hypothetical protein